MRQVCIMISVIIFNSKKPVWMEPVIICSLLSANSYV